jgi:toxin YoeB
MPPRSRGKDGAKAPHRGKRLMVCQEECLEDLRHWVQVQPKTAGRVLALIDAVLRDPFHGIGKPEPLKHLGPDIWARRITKEDRLVYKVYDDQIDFLQARYHY